MVVRTAGNAAVEVLEWVPVPGTRREGDELLAALSGEGLIVKHSPTAPGLAITYEDLKTLTAFALTEDHIS